MRPRCMRARGRAPAHEHAPSGTWRLACSALLGREATAWETSQRRQSTTAGCLGKPVPPTPATTPARRPTPAHPPATSWRPERPCFAPRRLSSAQVGTIHSATATLPGLCATGCCARTRAPSFRRGAVLRVSRFRRCKKRKSLGQHGRGAERGRAPAAPRDVPRADSHRHRHGCRALLRRRCGCCLAGKLTAPCVCCSCAAARRATRRVCARPDAAGEDAGRGDGAAPAWCAARAVAPLPSRA